MLQVNWGGGGKLGEWCIFGVVEKLGGGNCVCVCVCGGGGGGKHGEEQTGWMKGRRGEIPVRRK